ncbi:hypothetical protein CEXT_732191 [Caerostris extrusa]|uniref:Ycf15 n=1 Tax=Caerostris extrusa TaxID=172846 RepID=A0AAV4NJC7_CAEEX|nr:hypothetical protein CEXT_732191 [Caerostris extrusa]
MMHFCIKCHPATTAALCIRIIVLVEDDNPILNSGNSIERRCPNPRLKIPREQGERNTRNYRAPSDRFNHCSTLYQNYCLSRRRPPILNSGNPIERRWLMPLFERLFNAEMGWLIPD